jgi:hypothetical protein
MTMKASTTAFGLLEIKEPNAIKVSVELLREPMGALIAVNALLVYKLGGRVKYTTTELLAFLNEGRTLIQEDTKLHNTVLVEMSVPTIPPAPHRDSYL